MGRAGAPWRRMVRAVGPGPLPAPAGFLGRARRRGPSIAEVEGTRQVAPRRVPAAVVVMTSCADAGLHRSRVEGRQRQIPNWYELDWDHVEQARSSWVAPDDLDLVLDARGDGRTMRRRSARCSAGGREPVSACDQCRAISPAGVGREPARAEVEVAQLLLEVDVEPFAAGGPALPLGHLQEPTADPAVAVARSTTCRRRRRARRRPRPR